MSLEDVNTEWQERMSAHSLHTEYEVKEEWESDAEYSEEEAGFTLDEVKKRLTNGDNMDVESLAQCVKLEAITSEDLCDLSTSEHPQSEGLNNKQVKEEDWAGGNSMSMMAVHGLYAGHTVKEEEVGTDELQHPQQHVASPGSSGQSEKNQNQEPITKFIIKKNSLSLQNTAIQENNEVHKNYTSVYKSNVHEDEISHMQTESTQPNNSFISAFSSFASTYKENTEIHKNTMVNVVDENDERSFKCKHCNYESANRKNLRSHNKKHQKKLYKCGQCDFATYNKNMFLNHKKTHAEDKKYQEKVYKCGQCNFATYNKNIFQKHEKIHVDEKIYKCLFCSYTSEIQSDIKAHQLNHLRERPYKCTHCSFATPYVTQLRNHEKTHKQTKPYEKTFACACNACKIHLPNTRKSATILESGPGNSSTNASWNDAV